MRKDRKKIRLPKGDKIRLKAARSRKWWKERRARRKKYRAYLRSPEWAERREERLKLCNGICEFCNVEKATQVHHLTYERIFREKIDDLRGICLPCHEKIHGRKFKKRRPKNRDSGTKEIGF